MFKYRPPLLGGADATVIVVAEPIGIIKFATFDRRHFGLARPGHTAGSTTRS